MKPLENIQHYKIVLASNSPRRRELLSGLNLEYTVRGLPVQRLYQELKKL